MSKLNAVEVIKKYCTSKKYFSLKQLRDFVNDSGYSYSDETIKKALSKLKKNNFIFSAGRGFYSSLPNQLLIDESEYKDLIRSIKNKFPLLDFSLWSTKMIAPFFHHLQNIFYIFIYTERVALPYVRDFLLRKNQNVFLNPTKNELEKNVILRDHSIILRVDISRSKSKNHIAVIEKILVDFLFECEKLNIVDFTEYEKVIKNILNDYRINLSYLIDYAKRRKNERKIEEYIAKYANVTF